MGLGGRISLPFVKVWRHPQRTLASILSFVFKFWVMNCQEMGLHITQRAWNFSPMNLIRHCKEVLLKKYLLKVTFLSL